MKPGKSADFFRSPPPPGFSRESTIRLDGDGRFWHDGEPVTHPGVARAFASWIRRHPEDGRYILENGYDFCYLSVEDVPLFIEGVPLTRAPESANVEAVALRLFDGSEEPLDPEWLWVGARDALYTRVKRRGLFARFQPRAQVALEPLLREGESGVELEVSGVRYPIRDSVP